VIARIIRLITGAQARWVGCEPVPKQRIYFANHSSNLDAPVIWASLPRAMRTRTRPVAARDYWQRGPLRRWLANRVFRCVLINRLKPTAGDNPIEDMCVALREGDSLIIFPEGTRALDDDAGIGAFKPGLWHLAQRNPAAEFVPVYLENLSRILPKGEIILVPILAAVTFGTPLPLVPGEAKIEFLARAHQAVADLAESGER
jgi:1-acyl-sn-glycerol-3-phosphate acyltransferase